MRRAVATWAGLLSSTVLLTGALAGCTGDEPDDPATQTSGAGAETSAPASPTAEPSPDVTKPERPAAMDEHDADGAAAAAVYFLSLRDYMMKSGDVSEWKAMSGEACDFCDEGLEQAKTIAERGDTFSGGETTTSVVESFERDPVTGIWPLDVETSESATTITDKAGETVFEADASTFTSRVEVGLSKRDEWVIVTVAPVPEDA